jgi:hypothetical protein
MTGITGPYSVAPNAANEYLGRAKVFIAPWQSAGGIGAQQDMGNLTVFDMSVKDETKEKYESMDPTSVLYARAVIRQTVSLKMTGDELTLDNLGRALAGVIETITGAGAMVSAQPVTSSVVLGRYYELGFRNITTLTDVKQGSATLVLGTDYTADLVNGRIYILPTSSTVTAGSAITADFTYGAYTYNAVNIARVGTLDAYVRLIGNPVQGPVYQAEFWHVQFTPTGQIAMIGDDFAQYELEGMIIPDLVNHPTEPLGHIIQTG